MSHRLVGFDFGMKRIGVATGNEITCTAQALEAVAAKNGEPQWRQIEQILQEWRPDKLVVGLPLTMSGDESMISKKARGFANKLSERYQLPIFMVDERLSSNEADHLLSESAPQGKSRSRQRQKHRDSMAAELIIRTYMNDNRAPA